jgi:LPXTG-motif cell wall-anchored protein
MLYASVTYTGAAALIGLAMLAAGAPILLFKRKQVEAAESQDASPDPM